MQLQSTGLSNGPEHWPVTARLHLQSAESDQSGSSLCIEAWRRIFFFQGHALSQSVVTPRRHPSDRLGPCRLTASASLALLVPGPWEILRSEKQTAPSQSEAPAWQGQSFRPGVHCGRDTWRHCKDACLIPSAWKRKLAREVRLRSEQHWIASGFPPSASPGQRSARLVRRKGQRKDLFKKKVYLVHRFLQRAFGRSRRPDRPSGSNLTDSQQTEQIEKSCCTLGLRHLDRRLGQLDLRIRRIRLHAPHCSVLPPRGPGPASELMGRQKSPKPPRTTAGRGGCAGASLRPRRASGSRAQKCEKQKRQQEDTGMTVSLCHHSVARFRLEPTPTPGLGYGCCYAAVHQDRGAKNRTLHRCLGRIDCAIKEILVM